MIENNKGGGGCRSLNPGIFLGCTWAGTIGNPRILRQGGGVGRSILGSSWDVLGYLGIPGYSDKGGVGRSILGSSWDVLGYLGNPGILRQGGGGVGGSILGSSWDVLGYLGIPG